MSRDPRPKLFQVNRFDGGLADSSYLGLPGTFWRGENCEIRRFPRGLELAKLSENTSGAVIDQTIYCAVENYNGDTIAVGANGDIWWKAHDSTTWLNPYTDTGTATITDICIFNGYVYWTTSGHLHRILETETTVGTAWTTVTEDYKAFAVGNNNSHPMVEAFNKLYVGDGYGLCELSSAGVWTTGKITFPTNEEVRGLTFKRNVITAYTRRTNLRNDYGAAYFWDGTSDAYNDSVRLDGAFHAVCTVGNRDFLLAGHKPALYRMDGMVPARLKVIPDLTSSTATDGDVRRVIIGHHAMHPLDGLLYMAINQTVVSGVSYIEKGVWSWGSLNVNFAESLNLEHSYDGDGLTLAFAADGKLMWFGADGSAKEMFIVNPAKYESTGNVETRWFDAGRGWQEKDAIAIGIAFEPLAAGEQIDVYVETDHSGSYGSAILTASYAGGDTGVTYKEVLTPWTGKNFHQMRLKVKLTAGTSNGSSPRLLDLGVWLEDIKDNSPS